MLFSLLPPVSGTIKELKSEAVPFVSHLVRHCTIIGVVQQAGPCPIKPQARYIDSFSQFNNISFSKRNFSWSCNSLFYNVVALFQVHLVFDFWKEPVTLSNPVARADLYIYWFLLPLAYVVTRVKGIACVVLCITLFCNYRLSGEIQCHSCQEVLHNCPKGLLWLNIRLPCHWSS